MKLKKILTVFLTVMLVISISACGEDASKSSDRYKDYVAVSAYCDYVFETNVYTKLDETYAYGVLDSEYDEYVTGGGCTAVGKANTYDGMIIGRNMDLYITNKPSYVVRTDVEGMKKTFGLAYSTGKGEDFESVKAHGVEPNFYKMIPFLQTDVMNESGFYIEINMRYADYDKQGNSIFSCSGTLPNQGKPRLLAFLLPQYLGLRCETVDEAVRIATEELDLYTPAPNGGGVDWNFCFMIADSTGKYGVLEIAENRVVWNEATVDELNPNVMPNGACQANYYVTPEFYEKESMRAGIGRVDFIKNKWGNINSEETMYSAMLGVSYFQTYFSYCQYNNLSEFVGIYEEDGEIFVGKNTPDVLDGEYVVWDYDYVSNPDNEDNIRAYIKYIEGRLSIRRGNGTVRDLGVYWESTFTLVANATNKTVFVRFNENAKNIMFFKFSDWD